MFRFARYTVAVVALLALGGLGCQARATVPMFYQDERALIDDLDLLFLTDRPSRLTRWLSR